MTDALIWVAMIFLGISLFLHLGEEDLRRSNIKTGKEVIYQDSVVKIDSVCILSGGKIINIDSVKIIK